MGRIVLITSNLILNGLKFSLLTDQSELTTLIIGGDWNCTLTKKDKKGGLPWRPTGFWNLILMTMDVFDLVDIQRFKHPNINKFSYVSKALNMRSRIDFSCGKKFNKICPKS